MGEADRLALVERRTEWLSERVRVLEEEMRRAERAGEVRAERRAQSPAARRPAPAAAAPRTVPPRPAPIPVARAEKPSPERPGVEDLLGGRVLAWVGGIALLVGVVLFFALAVSHGWIGPVTRTLLAGAGSLALLCAGIWLHDRRGRTDAARAAVATSIAALYATVTVASHVYHLIPVAFGLVLAFVVGALATAIAVRWEARVVAALGIVGCLLAPVLVGSELDLGSMAFLLVAAAAAAAVLVWQRWNWLALAVFVICTPQWIVWLADKPSAGLTVAVLAMFGCVNAAAAIGFELRVPASRLRASSSFLLALNAIALGTAGWLALMWGQHRTVGLIWLGGLALVHLAVGLSAGRLGRVSDEIRLLCLTLGITLANVTYGLAVSGPALAVGWAGAAAVFGFLLRRVDPAKKADAALLQVGLGAQVCLALVRALVADAPPSAATGSGHALTAAIALSAIAAACLTSARLADGRRELRIALDAVGLGALAYLTAILLDGPALAMAWAAQAGVFAEVSRRTRDDVSAYAGAAFLAGALLHASIFEVPPRAFVYGAHHLLADAATLVVAAGAAIRLARLKLGDGRRWTAALGSTAASTLLAAASVAVVSAFQSGGDTSALSLFDLGSRQEAQVVLSAMWCVVGVAALLIGLRRDLREVRIGALALLLATVGKVFLFDLSALDSAYRVVSFVALGLLLLAGAFAWQRLRPRPLDDLRATPEALR